MERLSVQQRADLLGLAMEYGAAKGQPDAVRLANELIKAIDAIREADDAARGGAPLVNLTITTRTPHKWRFCDLETGQSWKVGDTDDLGAMYVTAHGERHEA